MSKPANRIVFMGTPAFACPTLNRMVREKENVVAVFTQPDRPKGRGQKIEMSPVKVLALEHQLRICQPEKINQEDSYGILRELAPDLMVVVAFGQILSQRVLDLPGWGCINVHASLLPRYRGAAPINWAIIRGETQTGITTMLMDKGLDTGDILLQQPIAIGPEETAGDLHDRLAELGAKTLLETIHGLRKGGLTRRPQVSAEATYAPLLKKEYGLIDWRKPAAAIHNQVRGMNPWPGAYTYLEGELLRIFRTRMGLGAGLEEPGTITQASDAGIEVSTGEDRILLMEIQLQSRKRMPVVEFLRGRPLAAGTRLG